MYTHTKSSCPPDSYSRHHTRLRINGTSLRLNSTGKITFNSFYVESLHFESFNLSTNTAVSATRLTLVLRFWFDWGLNKIFPWPLGVSVAKMHIVGSHYGIWGLGISHISTPPSELATNFWGAKDAPGKMQSFCALRKVPILGSKITIYRLFNTKNIAAHPKLHQFSCRFHEPMSRVQYAYEDVLLQCAFVKRYSVSNSPHRTWKNLRLTVSVFLCPLELTAWLWKKSTPTSIVTP